MQNSRSQKEGMISPINGHTKRLNGRLSTSILSPKRDVSFLSSTRITPIKSSPRYSLSPTNTPKLQTNRNGPLLASTNFNVNLGTYTDVKSPGLASRIVQYNKEQSKTPVPTHQVKYGSPGLFPIVHFFKKDKPVITPKKNKVTVKLSTPDTNLFNGGGDISISREETFKSDTQPPDISTRSVLDALKEISRKRIHGGEDFDRDDTDICKRTKRLEYNLNEFSKRNREDDSPPKTNPSPTKQITKRMCVIDPVYASSTSYTMFIEKGTKRKATNDSFAVQNEKKQLKTTNAETQTLQPADETSKSDKQDKSIQLDADDPLNQQDVSKLTIFDTRKHEILKKNKLATMLGAITGKAPVLMPLTSKDETDSSKIVSILSPKNKPKHDRHVRFDDVDADNEKNTTNKEVETVDSTSVLTSSTSLTTTTSTVTTTSTTVQINPVSAASPTVSSNNSPPKVKSPGGFKFDLTPAASTSTSSLNLSTPPKLPEPIKAPTSLSSETSFAFGSPKSIAPVISTPQFSFGSPKTSVSITTSASTAPSTTTVASFTPPAKIETIKSPSIANNINISYDNIFSNLPKSTVDNSLTPGNTIVPSFGIGGSPFNASPATKSTADDITKLGYKDLFNTKQATPASFGVVVTTSAPMFSPPKTSSTFPSATSFASPSTTTSASNLFTAKPNPAKEFAIVTTSAPIFSPPKMSTTFASNTTFPSTSTSTVTSNLFTAKPSDNMKEVPFGGGSSSTFGSASTTTAKTDGFSTPSTASAFGGGSLIFNKPSQAITSPTTSTGTPIFTFGAKTTAPNTNTSSNLFNTSTTSALTNTAGFGAAPASSTSTFGGTAAVSPFNATVVKTTNNPPPSFGAAIGTTASSSTFGSTFSASNTSAFGNTTFGSPTTTTSTFGATTTTSNNTFGTFNATTTSAPTFAVTSPLGGGFNNTSTFGAGSSTFGATPSGFGAATPATSTTTFGAATTTTTTAFGGGSSFGNASATPFGGGGVNATFGAATGPSTFGSAFSAPTTTSASIFGNANNTSTFTFGGNNATTTATTTNSIFGASATAPTTSTAPVFAFGGGGAATAAATTTTASTFGATTSAPGTFSFGGNNSSFTTNANTPNGFGNATGGLGFGGAANATTPAFRSASGFGNSTFGAKTTASATFSANNNNTATFGTAGTSSTFGQTATNNGFGAAANNNSTFGSFGGANNNQSTFGNTSAFNATTPANSSFNATKQANFNFGSNNPAPGQGSGVFSFGANSNAPATAKTPGVFSFGANDAPKPPQPGGFNFAASPTPNTTFGAASTSTFGAANNFAAPQFNAPSPPGMFSIGSGGSTQKPRTQLKAKRRNC